MSQKTPQEQAIEKVKGPCLIKAGAGTGKTYTIQKKVAYIVNEKICKPSEILCLTFSNEATNNLRQKVSEELKMSSEITIKTFHSFCAEILKELGSQIKISPDFEILQPDDAKVLVHKYLGVAPYYADRYITSISTAKDFGITVEDIEKYTEKLKSNLKGIKDLDAHEEEMRFKLNTLHLENPGTPEEKRELREKKKELVGYLDSYSEYIQYRDFCLVWRAYDKLKKEKNYQDYSDLNFNALRLFDSFGSEKISRKYKQVIVDEFQDTNKLQFDLISHLAGEHKNITVVGDPNQSIYGFRGSFREVFSLFGESFGVKKDEIFTLDKSRRSPNRVLRISHELIKNNYQDHKDCLLIENFMKIEGDKIKVIELKNGSEESRRVAELVEEEIEKGTPLNEICVLYRTHAQGSLIEQSFEAKDIPFVSAGKTDLLKRPEIKTAISYLSIINNLIERTGTGEQAWWSLFHYHNSLSAEDSIKIGRYLKSHRDDKLSVDYLSITKLKELDISKEGREIIGRIIEMIEEVLKSKNKSLPELVLDIYDTTGLNRQFTHERSPRNTEGLMNLKNFYDLAENYSRMHDQSLSSFIEYLEILEKLGVEIPASKITDINAVRLMTIHAVKGLEFDKVIVTNLAEGRFPIERTRNEPIIPKELNPDIKRYLIDNKIKEEDKEDAIKEYEQKTLLLEERRLCYVAFTRAKKELILTYARTYNSENDSTTASDFLKEINYKDNKDLELVSDDDEKCTIFAPCSMFEQHKSLLKKQLIDSLDVDDMKTLLSRLILYHSVREGNTEKYDIDLNKLVDKKEIEKNINKHHKNISSLKFDKANFTFSPTALETYDDCPKKYELQHIYQMPERGAFEWSGASTGSFIHELLEIGVKELYDKKEQFMKKAEEMSKEEEWSGIDMKDVKSLVDVFWARHKGKYNKNTLTEQKLPVELGGYKFFGITDRVDIIKGKDVEIVDYKTNQDPIPPKKRAWQLGFYAIGAKKTLGLNPVRLTLEMLRLDKPFVAEIDKDGNVTSPRVQPFNINDVEKELVDCAKKIVHDYETEFLPAKDDNKCRFCKYKFYCPKWEEK